MRAMSTRRSFPLVKAHAFGNDFLLMDAASTAGITDMPALARQVCDRHRGIGGDGLMLVEATPTGAETRLWNADGSRAEISGNGVRCAAAWMAHQRQSVVGDTIVIGTVAGPRRLTLLGQDDGRVTFRAEMGPPDRLREETIDVDGRPVQCVVLNVGNPQCVVLGPATETRLHNRRKARRTSLLPRWDQRRTGLGRVAWRRPNPDLGARGGSDRGLGDRGVRRRGRGGVRWRRRACGRCGLSRRYTACRVDRRDDSADRVGRAHRTSGAVGAGLT